MTEPVDRQWTTAARVALMVGVIVVIGMLGCRQLDYERDVKQQIVTILGQVAAAATGFVFGQHK